MPSASRRRQARDATARAYEALVRHIDRLMDLVPSDTNLELNASRPDGTPEPQDLPPKAAALVKEKVLPALVALEATLPLERSPEDGVWETLVLDGHGHSGNAWVVVANAIGAREHVTTFGTGPGYGAYVSTWAAARRESEDLGTSWDVARRERRVVEYDGGPHLIDRGANRIVDILEALGHTPVGSCEGHPWGAYAKFEPAAGQDLADAFAASGWILDPGGTFVRMPQPASTADRDARWRELCAALELRYGLEGPQAEPVALSPGGP